MKNTIIIMAVIAFIMGGCNSGGNDERSVNGEKKNSEHYLNFDDESESKSTATVDTVEFRNVMERLLPAKRIVELFGIGYQVFYLGLTIDPIGNVYATLAPDAGFWITGMGGLERLLFKENLELTNDYAIVPNSEGDSRAIKINDIFYTNDPNVGKAFNGFPGIKNGKKVRSLKIFQIDATVDNTGNLITPWSITEVDVSKFRPQIAGNLPREYYMGYFPAALKEDFKFIGQSMGFPEAAVKRGVRGRVLIKLFYEKDGEYAGYQLIKGLGYGCDEEVINTIKTFKPKSYPSGQRSTVLVPFNFGPSDKTPVDITVKLLEYDPSNPHNNLKMILINKLPISRSVKTKYSINVFFDGNLVLKDTSVGLNWDEKLGLVYYFGGNRIKSGEHDYLISIDPENVLNDIDRSNNTVKGKLVIK
ncbi:MAG: energy transducer TonB [Melioribacteraceae bacterium]